MLSGLRSFPGCFSLGQAASLLSMFTSDSLLYPSSSIIGYAAWFKHFAAKLPEYADRYALTSAEVTHTQLMAVEFTDWLVYRIGHATQTILQRRSMDLLHHKKEPDSTMPNKLFLLDQIALLVQRIRTHAAYTITDGCVLNLAAAPLLRGTRQRPGPKLQLALPLCPEEPPLLSWAQRRGATLELEVSREGGSWQALLPTNSRPLQDTYPQPLYPAQWQYRARYCWPDWPASEWSDVASAWVGFGAQLN